MSVERGKTKPGEPAPEDAELMAAMAQMDRAQEAVMQARKELNKLIVTRHLSGVSVTELSRRTGWHRTRILNLLSAAGL